MLKDYYELTKPGIIYSNVMTAAAGFLLASRWHFGVAKLAALLVGTALIIAASCVLNNYIDRHIDAKMTRTKKRAIVSGKISGRHAIIYAIILYIIGFAVLSFTAWITVVLGLAAAFSYVVLYGWAKRRTVYGTLVGTLPGAASLVAGYATVTHQLDVGASILFLIMVAWQMAHFYSIGLYRLKDYKTAGLPIWPVVKGARSTKSEIVWYVMSFGLACAALTLFGYAGRVFLFVMVALSLVWLWRGVKGFKGKNDTQWAGNMFGFSLIVLLSLSAMLASNAFLP